MKSVTVSLFLDTRSKSLEKGTGTIKVNIYYDYKNRLYSTGLKAAKKEWDILQRSIDENGLSGKVRNEYIITMYQELYEKEGSDLNRAKRIVEDLADNFSFESFKYYYERKTYPKNIFAHIEDKSYDVLSLLLETREKLEAEERVGHADLYRDAATSMKRFLLSLDFEMKIKYSILNNPDSVVLPFQSVTTEFLHEYEKWMLKFGKSAKKKGKPDTPASETTIGIYLRNVREVFNQAISKGYVSEKDYPFSIKKGFVIPTGEGTKKALSKSDIEKILNYIPSSNYYEDRSWCLWVFSYLSNGINFSDICRLKWENVDLKEGKIEFIRQKTARTTRGKKRKITTVIFSHLRSILDVLGTKDKAGYVFPFLVGVDDERRKKQIINQLIKVTNKHMNRIASILEIDADLDTYVARHSFATIILRSGAPLPFIQQSLGHQDIRTTQNYLGSFEEEQVKKYLADLI